MTDITAIQKIKDSPPLKRADIVLLIVLVLLAFGFLLFGVFQKDGDTVEVTHDGKTSTYALMSNRTLAVGGVSIVIEGGAVYVKSSTCGDKRCTGLNRAIRSAGQSIVCLPNNVVIKIKGGGAPDVVTGQPD